MAETIGLTAVMDLSQFNKSSGQYNKSIGQMNKNTASFASKASGSFGSLGKSMLSIGAIAGGAALAGVAALGGGIVAAGAVSLKTAISFESAFAGVIKTTDGLTDSTGKLTAAGTELRQGFVDLSKEVPIVFEELARIGELGGQLGIGQEALLEFTESVAALGVSTNLTTEEAATGLARMGNIFNVAAEDMGGNISRLGSTIVDLGNNFATTERDILAFGERISGAGAIAGLTQADVLGIGAAMSSVGVEAEAGGTAVQKVLLAINNAVVGTTTGFVDNTEAIQENVDKLTSLNGKLVALEGKAGLTGEQILQMRDDFIAAGGSAEEFGRQLGATERRQLFETALAVRDLTDETQTLRDLQGTPIDAGQLEKFASVAGLAATDFEELWKQDASQAFQLFVEGLGKQGDQAINTLDELGLTDQRLIRAFLSLSGAGDLLGNTLDTANKAFDENTALADEAAKRYATTESQLLILKNTLRTIGDAIGSRFLPAFNQAIRIAKEFIDTLFAAFEAGGIAGLFTELGVQIQAAWATIQPVLMQLGQQFFAWITETAIPYAQQQLPILFNTISQFITENWPLIVQRMNELSGSFFDWINTNVTPRIPEVFSSVLTGITTFLTESWPQIQDTLFTWADMFWGWVQNVTSQAGETLSGIIASIGQWALSGETQTQLADFGFALGQTLFDGINNLLSDQAKLVEILNKVAGGLAIGIAAITGLLIAVGGQIVAGILAGVLERLGAGEFEVATFNELGGILTGIAENAWTAAKLIGEDIVLGISQGVLDTIEQLTTTLEQIGFIISETFKETLGIASPSTVFMQFGIDIIQGLIDGIMSLAGTVGETLTSIFGNLLGDAGGEGVQFTSPEGLEDVSVVAQELSTQLSTINEQLSSLLPESVTVFLQMFLTSFQQVIDITNQVDLLIIKIATVSLVLLQGAVTRTAQVFISDFMSVNEVLNTTDTILQNIAASLTVVADSAKSAADAMTEGFSDAASSMESDLLPALAEVIKTLERVDTVATGASDAISALAGAGTAAPAGGSSGMGFQGGTPSNTGGLLNLGLRIPAGFPNDTYQMNVTSGEEVLVTPRGRSIEGLVFSRLAELISGQTRTMARVGATTQVNFNGPIYINNGDDMATFTQRVRRVVTGRPL